MSNDLMNLLDSSVEDLADLEKFTPIHEGTHKLQISFSETDSEEFVEVRMSLTLQETLELKDKSLEHQEPGKKASLMFRLCNKDGSPILGKDGKPMTLGQGQLKEILLQLQPSFGGNTLKEIMDNSEGGIVTAVLGVRANKNDPEQKFNTLKALIVE